jgi:hypothetical protein
MRGAQYDCFLEIFDVTPSRYVVQIFSECFYIPHSQYFYCMFSHLYEKHGFLVSENNSGMRATSNQKSYVEAVKLRQTFLMIN